MYFNIKTICMMSCKQIFIILDTTGKYHHKPHRVHQIAVFTGQAWREIKISSSGCTRHAAKDVYMYTRRTCNSTVGPTGTVTVLYCRSIELHPVRLWMLLQNCQSSTFCAGHEYTYLTCVEFVSDFNQGQSLHLNFSIYLVQTFTHTVTAFCDESETVYFF